MQLPSAKMEPCAASTGSRGWQLLRPLLLLAVLGLLARCTQQETIRILALGDSLTEGMVGTYGAGFGFHPYSTRLQWLASQKPASGSPHVVVGGDGTGLLCQGAEKGAQNRDSKHARQGQGVKRQPSCSVG